MIVEVLDDEGREHVNLAHRQVDLSEDQDGDLGKGEKGNGGDEGGQRLGVGAREEVGGVDREEEDQCEGDSCDDQLLQVQVHEPAQPRRGQVTSLRLTWGVGTCGRGRGGRGTRGARGDGTTVERRAHTLILSHLPH